MYLQGTHPTCYCESTTTPFKTAVVTVSQVLFVIHLLKAAEVHTNKE